ncbi:hypothetical protein EZ428_14725 [Pedobacter frigiditerrae]|uniref:GLPGLI family protein n=1 Tax=Pedobacter frigiditerrae TaxID=2530452 RepID=A0A4R0MX42_9SPHI|nr:hypothetical protein [Pedobacter frigiditerrae]TCC90524.1 hypothetical protein EZ428_14725 [Pedobacter frigiditerrae]
MNKILIAFVGLFSIALTSQAQKKSGAIQFETAIDPVAMAAERGITLSEEMKARMPKNQKANFELLFTATNASYMPVEDTEDSNGGQGGGGMMRMMRFAGGAGGQREYFYSFADQKLVEVFDLSDTTYVMQSKLTVASQPNLNMGGNRQGQGQGGASATAPAAATSSIEYLPGEPRFEIVKSDETKKIIGFNCHKAIVKTIRKAKVLGEVGEIADETAVWYTTELGFNFSPSPNMWTEGTVLSIETKGSATTAKSIEYRGVSAKDVTAPKKATPITQEEYVVKMQNMMKRFSGGNRGGQGGQVRSVIIN